MLVYILILFFIFLCVMIECSRVRFRNKILFFYFVLFLLLLMSAIRYDVGVDYINYAELYRESSTLNNRIKETGFALFFYIFNRIGFSYEFFIILFSFLTIFFLTKFIKKSSPYVFLSILIFYTFGQYYFNTFNAIRQTLAAYIFLYSLRLIEERRIKLYFLICIITTYFIHTSFLVLLPMYFVLRYSYSWMMKSIILVVLLLSSGIIVHLINMTFYSIYLEFTDFFSEVSATTYFLLALSILFFVFDFSFKNKNQMEIILYNINFISLVLLSLIYLFNGTSVVMPLSRISYYFTPVYIVLIPLTISRLKLWNNRVIFIIGVSLIFSALFYFSIKLNGTSNKIIPYKTIINK